MHGYGDPVFRNVSQPFKSNPPFIPRDYNPVGSYRKTFSLPANFKGKQIFLRLEAVTSASFLWINGKEVGFNKGANEPAEYNVTSFLKPGKNTIAINVYKYSDGTYLEDQDFWRLAGIFRDVFLFATPNVHIRDYYVSTDLDPDYMDAQLSINAELKNYTGASASGYSIKATIWDKNHQTAIATLQSKKETLEGNMNKTIQLSGKITNPAKWSDEHPNLYHVTLELIGPDGKIAEVLSNRIGFKEVEVKHQVLMVNGVPVKLNGINSHIQHPDLGHAMDIETMRKDLILMKQFNINCVRTSHYPPNIEYLNLADELGIYVVDETGDESHATEFISELPEWTAAYINRVQGMVLRDRNHPSIIFWSAGNESGTGNNICEVIKEGKRLDPSRIFMYGGNTDDVAWRNEVPCEDIIGPRYPTPYELKTRIGQVPESQDPRPAFMDEYIAATGNGAGGLDEYWDLIYQFPRISGGAIWDYVSPGIREKVRLVKDDSKNNISTAIKSRGKLVEGKFGKAIELSGRDQWIDVYRHPALDITGKELTLSVWVYPRKWLGYNALLTKGNYQYGLNQFASDSIEFYVSDSPSLSFWGGMPKSWKVSLRSILPQNWENAWHHVAGIYDGSNLSIYIDGKKIGTKAHTGAIANKPFPVAIGHISDIEGQEYPGNTSNSIFDRVSVFNKVISVEDLINPPTTLKNEAALWLELDDVLEKGDFFSMGIGGRTYGTIWPDRTPQPEMYQIKKSAQPVKVELVNPEDGTVKVWSRFHFTNLNDVKATWELLANDKIIQKGDLKIDLAPQQKTTLKIPFKKPELEADAEYRILVSFCLKENTSWASLGHEMAWDQLELPWKKATSMHALTKVSKPMFQETSEFVTIAGTDFEYAFSKTSGKLVSIKVQGKELVKDGPKLNVWRAPLANDIDQWATWRSNLTNRQPGMGDFPAGGWYTYGIENLKFKLDNFSVSQSETSIIIDVNDHAEGINYSTAFDNHYLYTIEGSGEMNIQHTVTPQGFMPMWLPKVGTQWILDRSLSLVNWYGRGPFENYPDRKTGAKIGIYKNTVQGMEEKYLIPQDYGNRCDNRWVKFETTDGIGLQFSGDELFNFSVQPYSTEHLTRARYPYQLQKTDDYTFNFDYQTSGVGCTAISVLDKYRVMPQEYTYTTKVKPVKK